MSVSYWMIEGVGIDVDKIKPYLSNEKLVHFLAEQLPDDEIVTEIIEKEAFSDLDINDFMYGEPFNNLGDLLAHCDDSNSLSYGDDGESGAYLFYPPSLPWERTENDPETLEEAHRRIVKAVQRVTDLSAERIEEMIDDDLYVVGIG